MKTPALPHRVTKQGVSVTIGSVTKDGREFFRVLYRTQGKRKQAWRSTFEDAKIAADDAIEATLTGDSSALKLQASDRHTYLRAVEFLRPFGVELDIAAREWAEMREMLGGRATLIEVCRDWLKRNDIDLPRVLVVEAVEKLEIQSAKDGKSHFRQKALAGILDAFTESFKQEVHTITQKMVAEYLTALNCCERTKRNYRDT